ncbi:hypothetical protein J437_LFUL015735 [Ladona fulva]|uniref:PiggyBac transposable element-derived protein domain-containing protein n=1 Tax=Ladona fulva TaxID=123851 RepID=A0A8K0KJG0_LADFU|nr:hypothetical protein J437_LFUL015735 [Ladona fulva]
MGSKRCYSFPNEEEIQNLVENEEEECEVLLDSDSEDEGDLQAKCQSLHSEDESDDGVASDLPSAWVWGDFQENNIPEKNPFSGKCGPSVDIANVLESFTNIFDRDLIEKIVLETNRYACNYLQSNTLFSRSRLNYWKAVDVGEVYVYLGLIMLMGIVRKPTIRSYFSRNPLLETEIFSRMMSQDRFESISKFLHLVDNSQIVNYNGNKKLFKIQPVIDYLKNKFETIYSPKENVVADESLWKGGLPFRQYIPLKSSKLGIKTLELCESETGYLWSFVVYSGADSTFSLTDTPDGLQTSELVIKLVEPLFGKGYCLWMKNYYNSPDLAKF